MRAETRVLIKAARALPERYRIALYENMLDSLDPVDPAIDQLWAREAADRMAAHRRGEIAAHEESRYRKTQRITVWLLETAEIELDEVIHRFKAQSSSLGDAFLNDFLHGAVRISHLPEAWLPIGEGLRRCRPGPLPYGLIYAVDKSDIVVLAVAHLHRHPGSWRDCRRQ